MDLLFLVILVIVVAIVFQDTKRLVYLIGILEVFFRLIHGIGDRLGISELNALLIIIYLVLFFLYFIVILMEYYILFYVG